jgi:hypothetical protein
MLPILAAEFIYKPRPLSKREAAVFDYTLRARLNALRDDDTLLLLCDSAVALASLQPILADFPRLHTLSEIVNPQPRPIQNDTPYACQWETPQQWQQMTMSDRWARIDAALRVASARRDGCLLMPALDAVYSRDLLMQLIVRAPASAISAQVQRAVPNVDTPQHIIDLHNAAFDRDALADICTGGQGFWGKLGVIPFRLCEALRTNADHDTWEDDLEMDRVLTELGSPATCIPVDDPALYHLAPPVFDRPAVQRIIERHLHYSLKIPGKSSALHSPPSSASRLRAQHDAKYALALALADALIAACDAAMRQRVAQYGASWVDWGGYRYVTRVGDPAVEVWQRGDGLL